MHALEKKDFTWSHGPHHCEPTDIGFSFFFFFFIIVKGKKMTDIAVIKSFRWK